MKRLKNRVGEVLLSQGRSVYEVSAKSGVSQFTIHWYVKNPHHLGKVETLAALAVALNVKMWDLLEGEVVSPCNCGKNG